MVEVLLSKTGWDRRIWRPKKDQAVADGSWSKRLLTGRVLCGRGGVCKCKVSKG